MTPEASQSIDDEIVTVISGHDAQFDYVRASCRRLHVLPLLISSGGFCGIRPSGELIKVILEDEPEEVEMLTDPGLIHLALSQGAKRYPRLHFLRPQRTSTSRLCTECEGDGRIRIEGKLMPENILCRCGGLGWVP
jgi:hypothetical protein